MKILILGGSNSQLNAILRAKSKGHTVIVADYYEDAPGKAFSDYSENISTFDIEGNIQLAHKYNIDGVMTIGTDQPVYTVTEVARALKLPALIDVDTAKAVTNKKLMKKIFSENEIPTVKYKLIREDFRDQELEDINFPVVIKPVDSQGQRGVYKLDIIEDIREVFQDVLSYSREKEILVEEFYPSDEITVSGWVDDGEVYMISIVDRISHNHYPHIGVCIRHHFPSKYMQNYFDEIVTITKKIVACFHIEHGPIYFQMLLGDKGIKVNEIACRIGGAYEDQYLNKVTGIDMLDMLIDATLGKEVDCRRLKDFDLYSMQHKISVEMFFARPCTIHSLTDINEIKKLPGVIQAQHNFKLGDCIKEMTNATQRAGYMIIEGKNEAILRENIQRAYGRLGIYNAHGENMIFRFDLK
ncbi:ATP-grasp domain-containing protein [Clostridiaceae bacterium 35-E11]